MKRQVEADRLLAAMLEGSRQDAGRFDGLRGNVGDNASPLLADMVRYLRACLLAHYSEAEARALLAEFSPPAAPGFRTATSVPDDVRQALTLLNMIASAFRCEPEHLESLLLGKRDRKRQAGTRAPRRPDISKWIDKQLAHDPAAKCPALWDKAPSWLTDQIGLDRFRKRVTERRGLRRK